MLTKRRLRPTIPRIRSIGNGDETMENRLTCHMMGKPPHKQAHDSSACKSDEANGRSQMAQHMVLLGEEFSACSALLSALGNENRQVIFLDLLRNWGGLRTYEIAEHVGLSKPTVLSSSQHHEKGRHCIGRAYRNRTNLSSERKYEAVENPFTACLESVSLR